MCRFDNIYIQASASGRQLAYGSQMLSDLDEAEAAMAAASISSQHAETGSPNSPTLESPEDPDDNADFEQLEGEIAAPASSNAIEGQ